MPRGPCNWSVRRGVENYGTAAFGPQQELLVLKDFVASYNPDVVVLRQLLPCREGLLCAYERSGGAQAQTEPGWRIKDTISRADTLYVVSAVRAAAVWWSGHQRTDGPAAEHVPVSIAEHGRASPRRSLRHVCRHRGRPTAAVGAECLPT